MAGAVTHLIAPNGESIQAMNHDEKGSRIPVDRLIADVRPSDYDALVLPGGVANPDRLVRESLRRSLRRPAMRILMHLLRAAKRPESTPAVRITVGLRHAPDSWRDYLYWNAELDDT
jgi:putative intracellular protease/amidase